MTNPVATLLRVTPGAFFAPHVEIQAPTPTIKATMIFSWFDSSAVHAFADTLVADLTVRLPPASVGAAKAGAKTEQKLRKLHDQMLVQVAAFARESRPNLYQKARLANRIKWAMREAGYPAWFVDEFAYELAAVAASANASREV